ncbi:hypothetical protein ABTM11_20265, partial [Acinetobacter baumannii]
DNVIQNGTNQNPVPTEQYKTAKEKIFTVVSKIWSLNNKLSFGEDSFDKKDKEDWHQHRSNIIQSVLPFAENLQADLLAFFHDRLKVQLRE